MAVEIRLLKESEIASANDFFNRIYKSNRSLENFCWEFIEGPSGKAIYVVAVDMDADGKIVGIQCAIPIELMGATGEKVLTAKSEDTLVDPSYRGQKIFERMYDLLFEECRKSGIQFIWGFTPAKKAFERIGFEIPFSSQQALLVLNPIKAYRYLSNLNSENKPKDRVKILGLCFLSWMKAKKDLLLTGSDGSLKPLSFNDKSTTFKEFYSGQRLYTLNESEDYWKWRVHRNPFGNRYENYQCIKHNLVQADAVINIRKDVSYIEQLLLKPGGDHTTAIKLLVIKLKQSGTPLIRVFSFNYNAAQQQQNKLLARAGFTLLDRGNFFVWKSLSEKRTIRPEELLLNRLFTQGNQ